MILRLLLILVGLGTFLSLQGILMQESAPAQRLTLLQMNVLKDNDKYDRVLSLVDRLNPDVVALQEIDDAWVRALDPELKPLYQYRQVVPRDNAFGIGLYSKIPFDQMEVPFFGDSFMETKFPSIVARSVRHGKPWKTADFGSHTSSTAIGGICGQKLTVGPHRQSSSRMGA